jgi:hypothetical protein
MPRSTSTPICIPHHHRHLTQSAVQRRTSTGIGLSGICLGAESCGRGPPEIEAAFGLDQNTTYPEQLASYLLRFGPTKATRFNPHN